MTTNGEAILDVRNLKVYFFLDEGVLKAVDGVDFAVRRGRTLGMVGESGCGKSVTAQAILRIVPRPGITTGQIMLYRKSGGQSVDLGAMDPQSAEIRSIRGGEISMIFQEPMKAFSPVHTIGNQIMEGILLHATPDRKEARAIAMQMLSRVDVPNPGQRLNEYPHQLSGGLRQRAMIAMALACRPSILVADEPTTALDVTVQAQVLLLMKDLQQEFGMSVIFITHDLGVIAEMADDVAVMYLGRIVEYADVDTIFFNPQHPYTVSLLESIPEIDRAARGRLRTIPGTVPVPLNIEPGCGFFSRCSRAINGVCDVQDPPAVATGPGHIVRCFLFTPAVDQEPPDIRDTARQSEGRS